MRTASRLATAGATAAALMLTGCASGSTAVTVVGTVTEATQTVSMPTLNNPTVNLDAGFAQTGPNQAATTSESATDYLLGSTHLVSKVNLAEGDPVRAGQVIAAIDDRQLAAQQAVAKADADLAKSQVAVLDAAIDETFTKAGDIADSRKKVNKAINQLTTTQAELTKTKAKLTQTRSQLLSQLAQAEKLLTNYPAVPQPGVPSKDQLRSMIAKLKAGIRQLDQGLAKITKAQPKLSSGLAKARDGISKLDDAAAKISDARSQLRGLKQLAKIAATASTIPVSLAEAQLLLTAITAPIDGVVVWVAAVGDRVAAGSPVAQIRAEDFEITAWLSTSQLTKVCLGDAARITGDWMSPGTSTRATLTRIAPSADFPPSSTTTEETHLTRAVEVEFTAAGRLPQGVPVEISITGCQSEAGPNNQDR